MDLPNTGLSVTSKPYTIPLKFKLFVDDEIKLLEDAGCISKCLSDWASPIRVVKKRPDHSQPNTLQLMMCINYRKVNQSLITTRNKSNSKVVSTFPLPKIQELLSRLNSCKYFSSLDLCSGLLPCWFNRRSQKENSFCNSYCQIPVELGLATTVSLFQYLMSKVFNRFKPLCFYKFRWHFNIF